jgi:hypothetical protein
VFGNPYIIASVACDGSGDEWINEKKNQYKFNQNTDLIENIKLLILFVIKSLICWKENLNNRKKISIWKDCVKLCIISRRKNKSCKTYTLEFILLE